jgi:hypothetical protein
MANYDIGSPVGHLKVVDKRSPSGVDPATSATTTTAAATITLMRTALAASTAHGVGYYTAAKLNQMTRNDMVSALRYINDAAGL